jgi:hypothetical protein
MCEHEESGNVQHKSAKREQRNKVCNSIITKISILLLKVKNILCAVPNLKQNT